MYTLDQGELQRSLAVGSSNSLYYTFLLSGKIIPLNVLCKCSRCVDYGQIKMSVT